MIVESTLEQRYEARVKAGVFGAVEDTVEKPVAKFDSNRGGGTYRYIGNVSFHGEKNAGEMGPVKEYYLDYAALRARSWQLYLESDIAQTVLSKFNTWLIGKGLKLESEPVKEILETEGLKLDYPKFTKAVEARFNLYAKSKFSDYAGMTNLNMIEAEAFKNAKIGGDCLVVLRVIKGIVTVQLIDGGHIVDPMPTSSWYGEAMANGHKIVHGVEVDSRGQHVAFYVRKFEKNGMPTFDTQRIPAYGRKTGMLMAYLYYSSKYRIDSHRGMPALTTVMETAKKLERYKEATVASAEERAKVAYTIEHEASAYSTGDNPLVKETARGLGSYSDDVPFDDAGNQIADKFTATFNKQAINLPLGAALKSVESKNELYFKDFYEVNIKLFTASLRMPVDVAMSQYNDSFSASRAALKDWENTLLVDRESHSFLFKKPIYDLALHVMILQNKIDAPGYLKAFEEDNYMVIAAYTNCRFTGTGVPHIDPLKEVKAERAKLGVLADHIPLTTVEAATETLNGGDSQSNMDKFAFEKEYAESLGIEAPEVEKPLNNGGGEN